MEWAILVIAGIVTVVMGFLYVKYSGRQRDVPVNEQTKRQTETPDDGQPKRQNEAPNSKQTKWCYVFLLLACIAGAVSLTCLLHIIYTRSTLGSNRQFTVVSVFSAAETVSIFISLFTAATACAIFCVQERRAQIESRAEDERTELFHQKLYTYYTAQLQMDIQERRNDCIYKASAPWDVVILPSLCICNDTAGYNIKLELPAYLLAQTDFMEADILLTLNNEPQIVATCSSLLKDNVLQLNIQSEENKVALMQALYDCTQKTESNVLKIQFKALKHKQLQVPKVLEVDLEKLFKETEHLEYNKLIQSVKSEPLKYDVTLEVVLHENAVGVDTIQFSNCQTHCIVTKISNVL